MASPLACHGRYPNFRRQANLLSIGLSAPACSPAVLHSKLYRCPGFQLQVHIATGISDAGTSAPPPVETANKILDRIIMPGRPTAAQAQPYASRLRAADTDLVVEEEGDRGLPGAGTRLLHALRNRRMTGTALSVSVWRNLGPTSSAAECMQVAEDAANVSIEVRGRGVGLPGRAEEAAARFSLQERHCAATTERARICGEEDRLQESRSLARLQGPQSHHAQGGDGGRRNG